MLCSSSGRVWHECSEYSTVSCAVHNLATGDPFSHENMQHCSNSHLGSQLTPCEYILAHISVFILLLQPGCCWRKPSYASALEETPQSDTALGPGKHWPTGRRLKNEKNLKYLQMHKGEDTPKQCLDLLSHSQLRRKIFRVQQRILGL